MGIFFKYVNIGHTFLSGLVRGVCDGVAPAAMIVGLCFTYTIIKRFREEKARIMDAK